MERYDAAIVGGGIIGLASAWRAQQRGLRVCVLERGEAGCGATRAAAGVLAPDPETPGFTALARRAAELWPAFAHELGDVGYTRCGSLVLAFDERELAEGWIDGDSCRALEPGISPACVGGLLLDEDAQVDPRRVVAVLAAQLDDLRSHADVVEITPHERRACGRLPDRGRPRRPRRRRLARTTPRTPAARPPVKGQTLRLRGPLPATRIIRSEHVYVVPRASGETVLGATIEEAGFDTYHDRRGDGVSAGAGDSGGARRRRAPGRRGDGEPSPRHA